MGLTLYTYKRNAAGKLQRDGGREVVGRVPASSGSGKVLGTVATIDNKGNVTPAAPTQTASESIAPKAGTSQEQAREQEARKELSNRELVAFANQASPETLAYIAEESRRTDGKVSITRTAGGVVVTSDDSEIVARNNENLRTIYEGSTKPKGFVFEAKALDGSDSYLQSFDLEKDSPDYSTLQRSASLDRDAYYEGVALSNARDLWSDKRYGAAAAQAVAAGVLGVKGSVTRLFTTSPKETAIGVYEVGKYAASGGAPAVAEGFVYEIKRNPLKAAFELVVVDRGTTATLSAGSTAVRYARTIGKTEVPTLEVVNPRFIYGIDMYPQLPLSQSGAMVDRINTQGVVYSGSPERLAGGAQSVKILTDAEKRAAGLDLSESGGLYAAERLSPMFTGVVDKGARSYGFGLPSFGASGSIQIISTGAGRIPKEELASFIRANRYLDQRAGVEQPQTALVSPAREFGKTESEVLISPNSVIVRTDGQYSAMQRFLKTDFEEFTFVPTQFPEYNAPRSNIPYINAKGGLSKTPNDMSFVGQNPVPMTPVAIRRYENIGAIQGAGVVVSNPVTRTREFSLSSGGGSAGTSSGFVPLLSVGGSLPTMVSVPYTPPSLSSGSSGGSRSSFRSGGSSGSGSSLGGSSGGGSSGGSSGGGSSGGSSGGGSSGGSSGGGSSGSGSGSGGGSSGSGARFTFRPPVPSFTIATLRSPSRAGSMGFNVLVRRQGVFQRVNIEPLTKADAFGLGSFTVENTAAASFKVVAAGGGYVSRQSVARGSGVGLIKKGDVYIQPRSKRIKTLGELQEITYKGIASQKNKKRLFNL